MSLEQGTAHEVREARTLLAKIKAKTAKRPERIRNKVLLMMATLDTILTTLPEDAPEERMLELERIVSALHTADQAIGVQPNAAEARPLELAEARIARLARELLG